MARRVIVAVVVYQDWQGDTCTEEFTDHAKVEDFVSEQKGKVYVIKDTNQGLEVKAYV